MNSDDELKGLKEAEGIMSKYILGCLFFVCLLALWPLPVYATHEAELQDIATLPSTQSTAEMDIYKPGSDDPLSTPSPVVTPYGYTGRDTDKSMVQTANEIMKEFLDGLMLGQGLEWNEAGAEYLPPGVAPDPQRVKRVEASRIKRMMPSTSSDDEWDFLPGYIPPDPFGVNTSWETEKPAGSPSQQPQPPQASPADKKSDEPASPQKDALGPDLIVY